jgi:hypothetical protein
MSLETSVCFQQKVSKVLNHLIVARTTKSGSTRKITQILSYMTFLFCFKALAVFGVIAMVYLTLMCTNVHHFMRNENSEWLSNTLKK